MSDNTEQYRWITTIKGNLDILFAEEAEAFVAGDLLWYPVEGHPELRTAPDIMVAFGRPQGRRGSYRQWQEAGIAPQVVFEILSPGNRAREMALKFDFYERFGVEEYYIYNPDTFDLGVWVREQDRLRIAEYGELWRSPQLGVTFQMLENQELRVLYPDGRPFLTVVELDKARVDAERRAEHAERRAEDADLRAARLAARLRELGIDPDAV